MFNRIGNFFKSLWTLLVFFTKVYSLWVMFFYIIIWIASFTFPYELINDHLNITAKIIDGTFTNLIGYFASTLGIIVAFLILIIGIIRERLKRFVLDEFLHNKFIQALITYSITVFVFNIISLLIIKNNQPSNHDLNLAYFTIYSTIIFLIVLFPLSLKAIESANPKVTVIKKVTDLNYDDFLEKHIFHFEYDDNNPVLILRNILSASYRENDYSLVNRILYTTTMKVCDLIKEKENDNKAINNLTEGLLVIWKEFSANSIKSKDNTNVERIFECLEYVHSYFSKKDISIIYLDDISTYIKNLLSTIIDDNIFEPIDSILFIINRILINHYTNSTPPEDKLPALRWAFQDDYIKSYPSTKDYDHSSIYDNTLIDNDLQWGNILDIQDVFRIILRESIKNKRTDTFFRVFHSLKSLANDVIQLTSLGKFHKKFIINDILRVYYYYQEDAIQNKLIANPLDLYYPDINLVKGALKNKQYFVVRIIQQDFEFLRLLHQNELLDLAIKLEDYIGAIGRTCMVNLKKKNRLYKRCMFLIIREIKTLKKLFEQDLHRNKNNYQALYLNVKSFIKYYNQPMPKKTDEIPIIKKVDYFLIIVINKLQASFQSSIIESINF
ncbi:hypothetical protein ES705_30137 [subsurface metagenome]